jgi:hypothetical protein
LPFCVPVGDKGRKDASRLFPLCNPIKFVEVLILLEERSPSRIGLSEICGPPSLFERVVGRADLDAFHRPHLQCLEHLLFRLGGVQSAGLAPHPPGEDIGTQALEDRGEEPVFKLDDEEGIGDVGFPQVALKGEPGRQVTLFVGCELRGRKPLLEHLATLLMRNMSMPGLERG